MNTEKLMIDKIPAVQYGAPSNKVYLYIHGKMGQKEEAEGFAELACKNGWQVLSMDLPGHGERKAEMQCFDPWHVVPELETVMQYIKSRWSEVSLRANSMGAWFSMLAYEKVSFQQCLFVSPILDMKKLIENMMTWAGVSEQELQQKKRIETSYGETLDWDYYQYAMEKEYLDWRKPTCLLYAGQDNLTDRMTVDEFVARNHCSLTVMENGEHWFHTPEQLEVLNAWTKECME